MLPQLIVPLREALNTRDPVVVMRTLRVIQALSDLGEGIGVALVPYYRQLLPVMAIFSNHTGEAGGGGWGVRCFRREGPSTRWQHCPALPHGY